MNELDRFKKAQDDYYELALSEITAGLKRGHYIWFIFPQLKGLGHSYYSNYYGLTLSEAKEYLEDSLLVSRLKEFTAVLLNSKNSNLETIFGSLDAQKVNSSLTLFDYLEPHSIFAEALLRCYKGKRCSNTLNLIKKELDNAKTTKS